MAGPAHNLAFYNDFRGEVADPTGPNGVAEHPRDGIHLDFWRVGGVNSYNPADYWTILNDSRFAAAIDAIDSGAVKLINPNVHSLAAWFQSQPGTKLDWRYSDPAFAVGRYLLYTSDPNNPSHSVWNPQSIHDPVAWLQWAGWWQGSGGSQGSTQAPNGGVGAGTGSNPAGTTPNLSQLTDWVKAHKLLAAGIGVGALIILGGKK